MPIFSAIHLVFPFPFTEEFVPYVYFDTEVPLAERERFMAFYRRSMQRTLYDHGPTKHPSPRALPKAGGWPRCTRPFQA